MRFSWFPIALGLCISACTAPHALETTRPNDATRLGRKDAAPGVARRKGAALGAARNPGMAMVNVRSAQDPSGPAVVALRVIQSFPRGNATQDAPKIGHGSGLLARGVLGVVSIKENGVARFEIPSGIDVCIQGLDDRGRAIMIVQRVMHIDGGEVWIPANVGDRRQSEGNAAKRPEPESPGSYPLSFARLVQPVLDRRCIGCHDGRSGRPDLRGDLFETENKAEIPHAARLAGVESLNDGWTRSYLDLRRHIPESAADATGARDSRLMQMLDNGHGGGIPEDDRHAIALWLDCGAPFYGAYHEADAQARGQLVPPKLGYLPAFEN